MTAYDEVPYTGWAYPDSHPDNLAVVATLFGMEPAPIGHCRVLWIACGDGANLIPMAHGLPGSQFVGIDLASTAVEAGRQFAARLGLTNLALKSLDRMLGSGLASCIKRMRLWPRSVHDA
ncbi:MAG: hypothetical protein ACUVR8_10165 [Acidobacteriota bacterium]